MNICDCLLDINAYLDQVNRTSMKRLLLSAAAVLFAFSANAQISSDTLTYTRGTLGVQAVFPVNINSQSSCADTMGISIPSGHWISSIELKFFVPHFSVIHSPKRIKLLIVFSMNCLRLKRHQSIFHNHIFYIPPFHLMKVFFLQVGTLG